MPDSLNIWSPELPLLIYDGDSASCQATIGRWREAAGSQIRFVTLEEVSSQLSESGRRDFQRAIHSIDVDGQVTRGAEAVLRAMAHCKHKRWLLWLYTTLPPFAWAAEACYPLVAASRRPITLLYRIWYGRELRPPTYHIAGALFWRLLGVVYLIAFVSLWTQIDGLVGEHGILPAETFLEAAEQHFSQQDPPVSPVWHLPTLAWISPQDGMLHALCAAGALVSLLLILGIAPIPALIFLWLAYLSLFHVGQVFLSFQWDILLLETGFVAIFVAPFTLRSRLFGDRHPPRLAIWLVWWLLFRLMFESGAVKLTWNDTPWGAGTVPVANTWETLTALDFHYWTQPLPIWTSWYAAQLPPWFQKLSVVGVFVIELGLAWLIFGPRPLRYLAFGGITLLMLLIAGTGNYNFFNLLAVILALTLLDDRAWPRFVRRRVTAADSPLLFSPTRWRTILLVPFAVLALLLGGLQLRDAVTPPAEPGPSLESQLGIAQFVLVNDYGLFRRMTETRPEIEIEASADGIDWQPYRFRWKPGDPSRRPRFNTPHQPRLDWQMWFEALRLEQVHKVTGTIDPRHMSPWFQSFLMQLATGEAKVLELLADDPFPDAAPKFIRVTLYQYRFTDTPERAATGDWWHRERVWRGPAWSVAQ